MFRNVSKYLIYCSFYITRQYVFLFVCFFFVFFCFFFARRFIFNESFFVLIYHNISETVCLFFLFLCFVLKY